jgi:polyisoprenoid-binding protein YceI
MPRAIFFVDDPMGRNSVQVLSRAPLETILVRSTAIAGQIEVDTDNVLDRPALTFSVPLESLDTGIPLMNEVMRSDRWLDVGKFPTIQFTIGRLTGSAAATPLKDGATVAVEAEGTLALHGASSPVRVRAEVTWLKASDDTARRLPGDILHVVARFDVNLPSFGIDAHLAPQTAGKVVATLPIEVDVFASTQRPQIPATMLENLARARRDLGQRLLGS